MIVIIPKLVTTVPVMSREKVVNMGMAKATLDEWCKVLNARVRKFQSPIVIDRNELQTAEKNTTLAEEDTF